jgi:hypothetical protein
MVEVQQNPFRPMKCSHTPPIFELAARLQRGAPGVISSADCVEDSFRFFNGRVFSTEYDLIPTSEARLN